jgi:hypothetical protein
VLQSLPSRLTVVGIIIGGNELSFTKNIKIKTSTSL